MPTTTIARLPQPSRVHATCAWCRTNFATIVDLIDHVDAGHTGFSMPPAGRSRSRQQVER